MTKTIKNFNNITKLNTKIGMFNRTKKKKYSIKGFIDENRNPNKIIEDLIPILSINQEHIEFFIDDGQAALAAATVPAAGDGTESNVNNNINNNFRVVNIPNQLNKTKKGGLILTSNVNRKNVSHSSEKQGINSNTSNKSIKTKLQNTKRFKVGFIKIFPGRLASKYLKVIGHLNLVIIDSGSQTIYHYEPKKKGVMLSLEKKLRFKMGEEQIKERLDAIVKDKFNKYKYVKIHGNQGSFNQYCSLYSIYGALKFALNLDEFYKFIRYLRQRLDNGSEREYNSGAELIIEKQTNKFIEKILKSIKQKNVRQLLKFYINEVIEKDRDKVSN